MCGRVDYALYFAYLRLFGKSGDDIADGRVGGVKSFSDFIGERGCSAGAGGGAACTCSATFGVSAARSLGEAVERVRGDGLLLGRAGAVVSVQAVDEGNGEHDAGTQCGGGYCVGGSVDRIGGGRGGNTASDGEGGSAEVCESAAGETRGELGSQPRGESSTIGEAVAASGEQVDVSGLGKTTLRNRAKRHARAAAKRARRANAVPEWRRGALPSLSGSVRTVDTRTAYEIEAADTLAQRRVVENKIAIAKGNHLLTSLADKDKTEALQRLDVVRVEERINTVRAKSQASYKKCGSPLESVGSAASAGEFAWKQQVRKQEALQAEVDSLGKQLDKLLTIATPAQFNMLARLELPHIPTDEEIAAMDEDCSPYYTREEAEAEAARYGVF